jgi:predicted amidohydrolase YtcJ
VLCNALGPRTLRLVTHHHIGDEDVTAALAAFERVLASRPAALG